MLILPCCSLLSDGVCLSELKGLLTYLLTYLLTRKTPPVRYGLSQWEIASIAAAKYYVLSTISLQKRKLPGTNFPVDHDRRHISISGTAKNDTSSLRLVSTGKASIAAAKWYVRSTISLQKHKLPGTSFPVDHDRRLISTSGTAKNHASLLRLEPRGNRVDRCRYAARAH